MANVITLEGGDIVVSAILDGGDIYPSGGGGGGLLQTKAVSYTPTESAQTDTVTADPGYDGLEEVDVTIGAISSTYVGTGVTRQAAQIIHPSTSDQSIPSGTYLTGTQGFKAVTTTNLTSGNIKNGVTIKVGDSSDDDRIISVTGTYSGGGANLESKSVSYTPTETAITALVTPSTGYDGLSQVDVTVGAISSSYVGSAVTRRDSSDLSASGATVTAPSGYYASSATKTISNASQSLTDAYMQLNGDLEVELNTGTAGYVSSGNQYLQFANFATPQSAQTIHPSTSDQTIPADTYILGAQTIKGVTYSGLDASNIKKDVVVKIGDSADDDRIVSVTGTYEGGGGTTTNDVLNSIFNRTISGDIVISKSPSDGATSDKYNGMFTACNSINSVTLNGWLTTPYNFLQNCTSIKSVSMPDATYIGTNVCDGCSNLETANFPLAETAYWSYSNHGGSFFRNCKKLTSVNMPKTKDVRDYMFQNCYLLPALELDQNSSFQQNSMSNCRVLQTLILRNTTMVTLSNVNAFQNTPFTGYGGTYSGHIYVPQSLISSYQTASNWSTLYGNYNGLFTAIEGSPYENARLDGTPLT